MGNQGEVVASEFFVSLLSVQWDLEHQTQASLLSLRSFEGMLNSSQEGGRISFPVSGRGEREAMVPFSSGTVCAPHFPCRESVHQTWTLG